MQQIVQGYRGVSLLVDINMDRILYLVTIALALAFGGFIGSL